MLSLHLVLSTLADSGLSFPPKGFGSALPDFAFFLIFAYYADANFRPVPPYSYRWLFFVLCVILALLFFIAWLSDLGAHL
jgi:hypothetical protein